MKAIIPLAGLGTRLLPFTKVIPKAMLPVYNKPCVQWIVEELSEAGIKEIIFVVSKGQEMIEEYFTKNTWYDDALLERGKTEEAKKLKSIRQLAEFSFVVQNEQLGDGHAILQAKNMIQDEPCMVIFGDCLYQGGEMIKNCIQKYKASNNSIIAVQEVAADQTHHYGIVGGQTENEESFAVTQLVEKPKPEDSPSHLAIIGRYVLAPSIWKYLEQQSSDSGEIRLVDAFNKALEQEQISALKCSGTWLDTGTMEGLHQAHDFYKRKFLKEGN